MKKAKKVEKKVAPMKRAVSEKVDRAENSAVEFKNRIIKDYALPMTRFVEQKLISLSR